MATHYKGNRREEASLNVFITLMRASDSLAQYTDSVVQTFGLTPSQFGVLETLYHLGPLCQKVVGEKLLATEGNVTVVVQNLEKRGLITRLRDGEDKRFVTVSLSAEGRRLIKKSFPLYVKALVSGLEHLSESELDGIAAACKKLGMAVRRRRVELAGEKTG
ncbi:MAG: MarR family transcriptional regulator [Spirochaetia bacterium]|nr:MarR family transcriptional regulator [Spirochaetia bacterium]